MKYKSFLFVTILLFLTFLPVSGFSAENEEILVSDIFYDTYILDALSDLSAQSGVSIIADDTVSGFITMEFFDLPLEEALERICIPSGYVFRYMEQGYYLVGSPDPQIPSFKRMAVTEKFYLNYISAAEALNILPPFYDMFIRSSDERDVITITALPEMVERFKKDLALIDTSSRQINIQAIVTEVSSDFLKTHGTDIFTSYFGESDDDSLQGSLSLLVDSLDLTLESSQSLLKANLRALERDEKAEIKADPEISVLDRKKANLFIGEDQIIILTAEGVSSRIERVEVGVSIEVLPRITGENEIELTLTPKISNVTEEINDRLRVRRSEISTTVRVNNGETLLLAGMTVEDEQIRESRIPILGSIPLLGWFFRETRESQADRELLIFITPEIL